MNIIKIIQIRKKKKRRKEKKERVEEAILNCLLFKGEAGVGKTNLLCYLHEKYNSSYPILFLSGGRTFQDETKSLEDKFNKKLRLVQSNNQHLLNLTLDEIETVAKLNGTYLILFIDAINESANLNSMRVDLGQILSYWRERNIAFVISCRDIDWRFFENETSIVNSIFYDVGGEWLTRSGAFLSEFRDDEFDIAWKKYKNYFKLRGKITRDIKTICKQPIMLRFLAEAYMGEYVPRKDIRRIKIFNKYWDKKLKERMIEPEGREFLFRIVSEMVNSRKTELRERKSI